MSPTLNSSYQVQLRGEQTKDMDLSDPVDRLAYNAAQSLADGVGEQQADLLFHDSRSLAAAAEDLDLSGVLTDAYGNTLAFAAVKVILIKNKSVTAGEVLAVGGAASYAFVNWVADASDIVNIPASGVLLLTAPYNGFGVTADTADLLHVDAGAYNIDYDIVLIGVSA